MTPLLAAPLLVTLTLLVSGLAKLGRRRETADAMTSLRLPVRPLHPLVATVLPGAEIVLALLLWVPLVPLQAVMAALIAVLLLAYLVIIARALTFGEPVECSCFGTLASPTVSRSTLLRNVLLVLLGGTTLVLAVSGDLTEAVVASPLHLAGWALALGIAVLLTGLAIGGLAPAADDAPSAVRPTSVPAAPGPETVGAPGEGEPADGLAEEPGEDGLLDYERTAIPPGVLLRPDGAWVSLRGLAEERAALLLFLSEGCGPCERVLDRVPAWSEGLGELVGLHAVLRTAHGSLRESTRTRADGRTLQDPEFSAREALGSRAAPSAVLLGADGMLAGGPVSGAEDVIGFVEEILEQIEQAQQQGALPA